VLRINVKVTAVSKLLADLNTLRTGIFSSIFITNH
jgi:hypothetical protein